MPKKDYVHLCIVLDASGSMGAIEDDIKGTFNTFMAEQKNEEGKTVFDVFQLLKMVGMGIHRIIHHKNFILSLCKGYWLSPKTVEIDKKKQQRNLIFSNPEKEYKPEKIAECKLRLLANVPIAFHIITTLWIILVGEKFDLKLSKNSYGNRIRRCKNDKPNLNALGSFNPYLIHYQAWRDTGLKVMRECLEVRKEVVAVTADFTSFYHNVSPDFLLNKELHSSLGIELSANEFAFTELIVEMLNKWSKATPLNHGLPVGCSISAVIANIALAELDFAIEQG